MNYSGNKKFYYFEIYYSEESAGTSYKFQSFYENLSHNNLEIRDIVIKKFVFANDQMEFIADILSKDARCKVHATFVS